MHRRTLGTQGLETSALGLGTTGMTMADGTAQNDDSNSLATIRRAFELGVSYGSRYPAAMMPDA